MNFIGIGGEYLSLFDNTCYFFLFVKFVFSLASILLQTQSYCKLLWWILCNTDILDEKSSAVDSINFLEFRLLNELRC